MEEIKIIIDNPEQGIANYEPLKAHATELASVYGGLIVSPDAIKDAKSDCAMLRKLAKSASDMRIKIQREHAAKIATVVDQLSEVSGIFTDAAAKIDAQVKEYDEQRKAARREEIMAIYAEEIDEFADMIPLDRLMRPQWLNKSTTDKAIRDDIKTTVINARQAIESIKGFGSKHENAIISSYLEHMNMMDALATKKRLEEMDAAMEKRKAEEEACRAAKEAEEKAKADAWRQNNAPVFVGPSAEPITGTVDAEPSFIEDIPEDEETGEVFDFTFAVKNVTQTQLTALVGWLEDNEIAYVMDL